LIIITKEFQKFDVRILVIQVKEWFVAKDTANLLGYQDTDGAIRKHCKKTEALEDLISPAEMTALDLSQITTPNNYNKIKFIPEPDVWRLIIKSRLPEAEKIEEWIFEEVLPEIRKTGSYSVEKKEEIEITDFQQMTIDSMNFFQLLDVLKSRSTFDLFLMSLFFGEKSPTQVFKMDFSEKYFLPSELGTLKGMSGAEMNLEFEKLGFQTRNENEKWELTEQGKKFAIQLGGKFSQIKWKLETILNQVQHKH
jgi:prophage antirepressor-like protein